MGSDQEGRRDQGGEEQVRQELRARGRAAGESGSHGLGRAVGECGGSSDSGRRLRGVVASRRNPNRTRIYPEFRPEQEANDPFRCARLFTSVEGSPRKGLRAAESVAPFAPSAPEGRRAPGGRG